MSCQILSAWVKFAASMLAGRKEKHTKEPTEYNL